MKHDFTLLAAILVEAAKKNGGSAMIKLKELK
jgi:hypothetical protein